MVAIQARHARCGDSIRLYRHDRFRRHDFRIEEELWWERLGRWHALSSSMSDILHRFIRTPALFETFVALQSLVSILQQLI